MAVEKKAECRVVRPGGTYDGKQGFSYFEGIARERIAYVGDSVTMDIGGARAAGLHPILLDPHDDHPGADFERITSLGDLL